MCPGGNSAANEFGILSPVPHEIHFRTGKKVADVTDSLKSIDISGGESTNGQYLFPFGANLGGINFPEALEFNLDLANQPFSFEGIPWDLDRRLSPGGCQAIDPTTHVATCESTPQPLDPFPFSEQDPRLLAGGAIVAGGAVPTAPVHRRRVHQRTAVEHGRPHPQLHPQRRGRPASAATPRCWRCPPTDRPHRASRPPRCCRRAARRCWASTRPRARWARRCTWAASAIGAATGVTVNGATALFNVINDARIDVTVPAGASGIGQVVVQLPCGPLNAPGTFTVTVDPLAPTLTSFSAAHRR